MEEVKKEPGIVDKDNIVMEVDTPQVNTEAPLVDTAPDTSEVGAKPVEPDSIETMDKTDLKDSNSRKRKMHDSKSEESASEDSICDVKDTPAKQNPVKIEKDDSSAESDLNIPVIDQSLGKGKRARIPNKRYSDILLSPTRPQKISVENGDKPDKFDSENDEEVASLPSGASIKSRSNTSSPAAKRQKIVDPADPKYLKPFELGWKRELVYRASSENMIKRAGDIYYYTPTGKKVRSMREISENLRNSDLTLENFLFLREPIGLNDPEKEIIRDAKVWSKKGGAKAPSKILDSPPKSRTSMRNLGNIKVKLPPTKTKSERKSKAEEEISELEAPNTRRSGAKKTAPKVAPKQNESKAKKRPTIAPNNVQLQEGPKFMENYLQNLCIGYSTLLQVFQYLKVQDLLRAGCVCSMWRDVANHQSLWRTVRMKNSQVHSFQGLANSLQKHNTVHLDLRKMLLFPLETKEIWAEFSTAIEKVQTLRKIEFCRCPSQVVEKLATTNKDLEVVNAMAIRGEQLNLDTLAPLQNLKELRLKSPSGLVLTSGLNSLKKLTQLTHLSLTSVKELSKQELTAIGALTNLESLDIGECVDFPADFGKEILQNLTKLEKLRLEKGQGNCHIFEMLDAIKEMTQLEQLELVNFDIKPGFDVALGGCSNIKKLLIIPTYISQSATTNHMVLGGVLRLQNTLSQFVWGVTLELLRVTELFVDQSEDPEKKKEKKTSGGGDSIPVLKPVPLVTEKDDIPPAHDPPQVEIIPLANLQKLLLQSLPTTRVKILKIPFHATWRQSFTDTVN